MPQQTMTEGHETPIFDALAAEVGFEWEPGTDPDTAPDG